jgi:hypothetical protein
MLFARKPPNPPTSHTLPTNGPANIDIKKHDGDNTTSNKQPANFTSNGNRM